ncbi:MAG TPA: VTT domain-containing protein [Tepidisphaeraceae bacterium]|nr:VTT domain-containing protein [Tepidisphaeraceae bacterium]
MKSLKRPLALIVLLLLIAAGLGVLFGTHSGRVLLHHPHRFSDKAHEIVTNHPILSPVVFIASYAVMASLILPMWWLDILAGVAFGILGGIGCCEFAGMLGAAGGTLISRWLASDWYSKRIEQRIKTLRKLDKKLDHNGLLVVMVVRLCHVTPFGASNYVFGIIGISLPDVLVGTVLGALPSNTISVTLGAEPHLVTTSTFIALLVVMHVLLLIPLGLRYIRPNWFKRIGIE